MLKVLYEDDEILVVIKPAGVESQAAKRFAPDMVSEVKKHLVINKSCTPGRNLMWELSTDWTSLCPA